MQFKQGDKVQHRGGERAEVLYGPFNQVALGGPLVGDVMSRAIDDEPAAEVWATQGMRTVPKFVVCQVVRARYLTGGLAKVAAGPFKGQRSQWYVLELPEGHHCMEIEEDISPVVE